MKYFSLLLFLLLAACQLVIDVEKPDFKPSLTVGCFMKPDSTISLLLTKDKYVLDNKRGFDGIRGAEVRIFENDALAATLIEEDAVNSSGDPIAGFYTSSLMPKAGSTYRLEIDKAGFTSVSAIETVPAALPKFEVVSYNIPSGDGAERKFSFKLRIEDPPGEDYYEVQAGITYRYKGFTLDPETGDFTKDTIYTYSERLNLFSDNLIIEDQNFDRSQIFQDQLFDGKSVDIIFQDDFINLRDILDSPDPDFDNKLRLRLDIRKLSAAYFNYLNTSSLQSLVQDDPFSPQPVQIYTNIENGRGVLGSYVTKVEEIKLELD